MIIEEKNEELIKIKKTVEKAFLLWKSPSARSVSQWADDERFLSSESSAESGRFRTSRAEYQRDIMDAFSNPYIWKIVCMTSAQIGKTEILNNVIGSTITDRPCSIIVSQPTVELVETWSKRRLTPMLRDTPVLRDKIKKSKEKNKDSQTILEKTFPGGYIAMVGANSPVGLSSRPIKLALADEIDRNPLSAGDEGDPINLLIKRTVTYFDRKVGLFSTPVDAGISRIEAEYNLSDKRRYFIPCPLCGRYQLLKWPQIKFDKTLSRQQLLESIYYECLYCGGKLNDNDINNGVKIGAWIAAILDESNVFNKKVFTELVAETKNLQGVAGFHLNEIYSPWRLMSNIVDDFLNTRKDPVKLKTWVNTSLGEPWSEPGESINDNELLQRREKYNATIPKDVLVLTAGVDVQKDRFEISLEGWGLYEENWLIDYKVIYCNPADIEDWKQLEDFLLNSEFAHEKGIKMRISSSCIDTGFLTENAYRWGKNKQRNRLFLIKGIGGKGRPIVSRATNISFGKTKRSAIKLFPVGVHDAKQIIYSRLRKQEPGAGYMHFPLSVDKEYFEMLTAEKLINKNTNGYIRQEWVKVRERNEALDCKVYAYAALKILNPNFEKLSEQFKNYESNTRLVALKEKIKKKTQKPIIRENNRTRGNFATSWKGGGFGQYR